MLNELSNRVQTGTSISVAHFYNQVYSWMFAGLGVTGLVAYLASMNHAVMAALTKPLVLFPMIFIQFGLVMAISGLTKKISTTGATLLFMLYAAVNGLMFSVIFLAYAKASIATAFFISAGTFGAFSIYGYTTKKDLSTLGSLCIMALFGLIIAMIVNIFVANSLVDWLINIFGVLIFVGLTAYDTQKLRDMALEGERMAIVGSLSLYLDFLNLFLFILDLVGGRKK
jgi:FtsH-binding integral membrane protein